MLHPTPSHRSVTQDDDGWLAELGLDEEDNSNTGDSESASEPLAGLSLGASANIAPLEILNPNDTPALADAIAVLDEINNEPR